MCICGLYAQPRKLFKVSFTLEHKLKMEVSFALTSFSLLSDKYTHHSYLPQIPMIFGKVYDLKFGALFVHCLYRFPGKR